MRGESKKPSKSGRTFGLSTASLAQGRLHHFLGGPGRGYGMAPESCEADSLSFVIA